MALPAIAAATGPSGPLAGLRTALSLLGASLGFRPVYDIDVDRRRADTLAACAAAPTLLTALYRLGRGWSRWNRVTTCRTRRTTSTC